MGIITCVLQPLSRQFERMSAACCGVRMSLPPPALAPAVDVNGHTYSEGVSYVYGQHMVGEKHWNRAANRGAATGMGVGIWKC